MRSNENTVFNTMKDAIRYYLNRRSAASFRKKDDELLTRSVSGYVTTLADVLEFMKERSEDPRKISLSYIAEAAAGLIFIERSKEEVEFAEEFCDGENGLKDWRKKLFSKSELAM